MISQIKCSILCIQLFILYITVLHSLPNVTNFEINKEQIIHCENWQFKCENGQCIPSVFVCDGLKNCQDASDETYDQCRNKSLSKCDEPYFQCQYGACIEKHHQCDGVKHCIDGSDESPDICNASNDESNKIRIRRNANDKSCAAPTSSVDRTVGFPCNGDLSRTCKPLNGYSPEASFASVNCAEDYYIGDNSTSSFHTCYDKQWHPPITKCLKKCDKLNPVNVILRCYRGGVSIDNCDSNSILLAGTKIIPSCIPSYKYDIPPSYPEITCNKDGRWNHILHPCVPECGKPYVAVKPLIAGGKKESIGGSPWQVAIFEKREKLLSLICGGTIISEKLVISAAHCFEENCAGVRCVDVFELVVGKHTNNYSVIDNSFQRTMKIKEILFPKTGYQGIDTRHAGDVAILILTQPIPFSRAVSPACIPWEDLRNDKQPWEGEIGKVSGWGRTENGTLSSILKTINLPFIGYKQCLKLVDQDFRSFLTGDKFCAGSGNRTGETLLDGDSGGGLLFPDARGLFHVRGVVSVKSPSSNSVVLFTDLSKHFNWIKSVHNEIESDNVLDQSSILLDNNEYSTTTTTRSTTPGKRNQDEGKRRSINELANHLKSNEFHAAEQKLARMDPHTYYEVAHGVYNSGEGSFNLFLNFSDNVENAEQKFKIFEFLCNETASSGLNDVGKFLQISRAVKKGILDRSREALAAERLYQKLNDLITKEAAGQISSAFINDDSWSTVAPLSADILDHCEKCTIKIYSSVVETVWDKITIDDLLTRASHKLTRIVEDVIIHLATADKLERLGVLNASPTITLAFYMNKTLHEPKYKNLKENLRPRYEKVALKLFQYHQNLTEDIMKHAAKLISSAFENDDLWLTAALLSKDILSERKEYAFKIYSTVVETVWDKISIEELLIRAHNKLNTIEEAVAIHVAALDKLERLGALNTSPANTLALYINATMHMPNYKNVNENIRSRYENVTKKLFPQNQNSMEDIKKRADELISSAFKNDNSWPTFSQLGNDHDWSESFKNQFTNGSGSLASKTTIKSFSKKSFSAN